MLFTRAFLKNSYAFTIDLDTVSQICFLEKHSIESASGKRFHAESGSGHLETEEMLGILRFILWNVSHNARTL